MSLRSFSITNPDGITLTFTIEKRGGGVSERFPQTLQLSGIGSLKTDINFSNLVGGGRYIYGSVVQQREISFAVWFSSTLLYKNNRDRLNQFMRAGQDPANKRDLNSKSEQLRMSFLNDEGIEYEIWGYLTEVKSDLFAEEPILWGTFVCSEDRFSRTVEGESESVLKQHFGYDKFTISTKPYVLEEVTVKEGNIKLASRFFKLPSGWNKYSSKYLTDNVVGVSFDVTDPVKIYGIKLDIFEDWDGNKRGSNQMVHLRGFDPTNFPSGVKYMFTRLNGDDTWRDTVRVICFDSGGAFGGTELKNYTVSDAYALGDRTYPFEGLDLRNDDSSGIWVYALNSASLPSKVSMWIDSDNPDYGDQVIYKDSILDV